MNKINNEDFEHSIKIPVPLGEKVWTFWTDCCHACYFQEKENRPACVVCSREAPCHTLKHIVQSKELSFGNLEDVIKYWGVFYFKTKEEAEKACDDRIEANIKKMRELGYMLKDDGHMDLVAINRAARNEKQK